MARLMHASNVKLKVWILSVCMCVGRCVSGRVRISRQHFSPYAYAT